MPAFTSIALGVLAAGSIGSSIYSADQQKKAANDALAQQQAAQAESIKQAKHAEDVNQMEMNKANQKKADISAIMKRAAQGGGTMLTSTTGIGGTTTGSLGSTSMLGS